MYEWTGMFCKHKIFWTTKIFLVLVIGLLDRGGNFQSTALNLGAKPWSRETTRSRGEKSVFSEVRTHNPQTSFGFENLFTETKVPRDRTHQIVVSSMSLTNFSSAFIQHESAALLSPPGNFTMGGQNMPSGLGKCKPVCIVVKLACVRPEP